MKQWWALALSIKNRQRTLSSESISYAYCYTLRIRSIFSIRFMKIKVELPSRNMTYYKLLFTSLSITSKSMLTSIDPPTLIKTGKLKCFWSKFELAIHKMHQYFLPICIHSFVFLISTWKTNFPLIISYVCWKFNAIAHIMFKLSR